MYSIRNWDKFQHYKHRNPPWIRLYRELADDPRMYKISAESFRLLVMLWLIAAENDGNVGDIDTIAWRLRIKKKSKIESCIRQLLDERFIVASKTLAK